MSIEIHEVGNSGGVDIPVHPICTVEDFRFETKEIWDSRLGRVVRIYKKSKLQRLLPYRNRLLNQIYAAFAGYFWAPCDLCGNYFGGHEWYGDREISKGSGRAVCPLCALRMLKTKGRTYGTTKEWQGII